MQFLRILSLMHLSFYSPWWGGGGGEVSQRKGVEGRESERRVCAAILESAENRENVKRVKNKEQGSDFLCDKTK